MGEEVVSSYLRSKLSSILKEVEDDSDSPSHILSRISIERDQIKSNSPMMIPVDRLYKLIELVSECRVFAYTRRTAAVSKKGFDFITNPVSEFMFNRRMKKLLREIVNSRCPNGSSNRTQPQPPDIKPTSPSEDSSHFIGFEADTITIETWLMPKQQQQQQQGDAAAAAALNLRGVGIVGRCGCGKTALAQKVFDSPRIMEEFSPRIWVCLSDMLQLDNPTMGVVNYILKEIGGHNDGRGVEELQLGLKGKRYLIVLDNAWRRDDWYKELLSRGLPTGSGGAVIVTSRREDVIPRMFGDDEHVIRLQPHLSDENCWEIFSQVLQQQRKMYLTNSKLYSIQDDVKRSIDGLPLAAKTLANILPGLLLKTHWIRARDLNIAWKDNASYWRWTFLTPPHQEIMEEVAELVDVCWLDIKGSVGLKELLINTSYSDYLVFKLKKYPRGLKRATARVMIVCDGKDPEGEKERIVSIESEGARRKGEGEQGWMEMKLGDIFTTLGDDDDGRLFEASFFEQSNNWKSGLVVKGIEFRPS